jgi:3,4-dihydroxy 2-butanone 4-phosphate synthase/GTP cyclohydrolase II
MDTLSVQQLTSARIPTVDGEFVLSLYENTADDKDHLALIYGDLDRDDDVLVRVHSECFTGDVLGSLRCDCGEQLNASMRRIASEGAGVLLYLRQEGRGIGLHDKLKAYNLQDEGYDTVEANQMLGHGADERDYSIGAQILEDLGIGEIRLLTNNPEKIESLEAHGVTVSERVPLQPHLNRHNTEYLQTKVQRMRHLLELGPLEDGTRGSVHGTELQALRQRADDHFQDTGRPYVTLTYAQSLDGSIASADRRPLPISGEEAMTFTHQLRASHDAILVGIGTILSDNPRLNVRHSEGTHPTPVVLDTNLRFPTDAQLFSCEGPNPIIATNESAPEARKEALEARDATVIRLSCVDDGICLDSLLEALGERDFRSVMVEGGTEVITSFLSRQLVDHMILTIAPILVGGQHALRSDGTDLPADASAKSAFPRLENVQYQWFGEDLVMEGTPVWPD